jgi:hypothetical protein
MLDILVLKELNFSEDKFSGNNTTLNFRKIILTLIIKLSEYLT